jgi:predicted MFS family arabinose efflux permease
MFLFNMRAMISVISAGLAMVFMLFFNAILSEHLNDSYKLEPDQCGYIMALGALFYAVASPLVGIVFHGVPRRYVT